MFESPIPPLVYVGIVVLLFFSMGIGSGFPLVELVFFITSVSSFAFLAYVTSYLIAPLVVVLKTAGFYASFLTIVLVAALRLLKLFGRSGTLKSPPSNPN